MSEQSQVLQNSKVMVIMTSVSRVFGLVRDQLIAYLLGVTRAGDIWAISFMIPNLFRRLIGEGAMSTAFVPMLAELETQEQERASLEFMRSVFSLILTVSALLVTLLILLLPFALPGLLRLTAVGDSVDASLYKEIIAPTRLMLPYLIFISVAAICQGVLNVRNRFALPAMTPIVLNLCIIAGGLGLRGVFDDPMYGLGVGVLAGGFLQFFLQWLQLDRMGLRLWPVASFWNKRTREAVRLWAPSTFSAGVTQINALVSTAIALNLGAGAAIALQTSHRMMELVLGVFSVALSTALLPVLSRQRARADQDAMADSLYQGLGVMALITVPAALGLILAGPSLVSVLFERGAFDRDGVMLTSAALLFHGMALLPIAWYRVAIQSFYAHKQVKAAVRIAVIGACINMLGCFLLPRLFPVGLTHCGVALATLVSSWSLVGMALFGVEKRFNLRWPRSLSVDLIKILIAGLAFAPLWLFGPSQPLGLAGLAWRIFGSAAIYGILVVILDAMHVRRLIRRR